MEVDTKPASAIVVESSYDHPLIKFKVITSDTPAGLSEESVVYKLADRLFISCSCKAPIKFSPERLCRHHHEVESYLSIKYPTHKQFAAFVKMWMMTTPAGRATEIQDKMLTNGVGEMKREAELYPGTRRIEGAPGITYHCLEDMPMEDQALMIELGWTHADDEGKKMIYGYHKHLYHLIGESLRKHNESKGLVPADKEERRKYARAHDTRRPTGRGYSSRSPTRQLGSSPPRRKYYPRGGGGPPAVSFNVDQEEEQLSRSRPYLGYDEENPFQHHPSSSEGDEYYDE